MSPKAQTATFDLDADVNQYLDFKIPAFEGKPVTMRKLMQHTAGFEEQAKGIIIESQRAQIEAGIDRASLQQLLPHGGARNALDCAL